MNLQNSSYSRALAAYHGGDADLCFAITGMMLEENFEAGAAHLLRAVSARDTELLLSAASLEAACRYSALDAETWFNRGVTAEGLGQMPLAIDCYRRAHALDPKHIGTLLNGAQLLRVTEHFEEAVMMARRLQYLMPEHPAGYANEAVAAIYLGDIERSDWAFEQAIRLSDDPSLLLWEQHFSLLARQRFTEAWRNYECRFLCTSAVGVDDMVFDLPRWNGDPGCHVVAYGEQGLGDQIMFASMVNELARDCQKVSLAVSPPLVEVFAASFPNVAVEAVRNGRDPDECAHVLSVLGKDHPVDACIPLGSLLTRYRNERDAFTGATYLRPSKKAASFWKGRFPNSQGDEAGPLRVGLCWASNPAPERFFSARRALHKTMPLSAMSPLIEGLSDAHYVAVTNVSLTQFEGANEFQGKIEDVSAALLDLDRTAALLQSIDLLITVDTGVAHLAGALGVPVWILLHHHGDARWGEPHAPNSYWYESARLFWQKEPGDWGELIERVAQEFGSFAKARAKQVAKR